MATAKVYRPTRNWKGEKPDDGYLGDVTGVIMGGASPQGLSRFPGVVSTEGQVGIPYAQDSGIEVQQRDLLEINDVMYIASGPRMWEEEHVFADVPDLVDDYYWIEVQSYHGAGR
jgi:hypothetical protein